MIKTFKPKKQGFKLRKEIDIEISRQAVIGGLITVATLAAVAGAIVIRRGRRTR